MTCLPNHHTLGLELYHGKGLFRLESGRSPSGLGLCRRTNVEGHNDDGNAIRFQISDLFA